MDGSPPVEGDGSSLCIALFNACCGVQTHSNQTERSGTIKENSRTLDSSGRALHTSVPSTDPYPLVIAPERGEPLVQH